MGRGSGPWSRLGLGAAGPKWPAGLPSLPLLISKNRKKTKKEKEKKGGIGEEVGHAYKFSDPQN